MSCLDINFVGQLQADLEPRDFRSVVETFGRDLEQLASAMHAAAEAGDARGFGRRAHRLAGAAAAIGASSLSSLARAAIEPPEGQDLRATARRLRDAGVSAYAELRSCAERTPAGGH